MKQSQFYYLLRRGLFKGASIVKEGLVMFNKFTTAGISHPAQGSAEFDGASDYIQLDTPFSYTNNTIAAWVYVEDDANTKNILDNREANDDGFLLAATSTEQIRYSINTADILTTDTYANQWVYAVGTYDGTTQKLYIDGSQIGSASISETISTSTNALIGARSHTSLSSYFNGNLANVAIWNRALSSDEINSVMWKGYQSLTSKEKTGLQAWYSLDDISGTSVPDSSGNGNNGTAY